MNNTTSPSYFLTPSNLVLGIVLLATLSRIALPPLLGHSPNFSPIDAIALFCGAYFSRRLVAIGIAIFAIWAGDILLSKLLLGHWTLFYPGFYWQYGSYALITCLGSLALARRVKILPLILTSLAASSLFFIISNFGVWANGLMYPQNFQGLMACYIVAIPFFKNTLLSDLLYAAVLFGTLEWVKGRFYIPSRTTETPSKVS
jgi:hypothetical protein